MKKVSPLLIGVGGPLVLTPTMAVVLPLVEPSLTPATGALAGLCTIPFFLFLSWFSVWTTSSVRAGQTLEVALRRIRIAGRWISRSWLLCLGYVVACYVHKTFDGVGCACFCWVLIAGLAQCALVARSEHLDAMARRGACKSSG